MNEDEIEKRPPVDHNGKLAVRAYDFTQPGGIQCRPDRAGVTMSAYSGCNEPLVNISSDVRQRQTKGAVGDARSAGRRVRLCRLGARTCRDARPG